MFSSKVGQKFHLKKKNKRKMITVGSAVDTPANQHFVVLSEVFCCCTFDKTVNQTENRTRFRVRETISV